MAKSSGFMQDAGLHKPRQNEIKNKWSSRKDFTYYTCMHFGNINTYCRATVKTRDLVGILSKNDLPVVKTVKLR